MSDARHQLVALATGHVGDMLAISMEHTASHGAVVLADAQCELAGVLAEAYRNCLPQAAHGNFYELPQADVLARFAALGEGDLVVLIQSQSFRMEAFRIRVELFKRGIKVIEHANLARMAPHEMPYYVEALAYDASYYRGVGNALKAKLDAAARAVVESAGATLVFDAGFEAAKLNTGDFAAMKNVGSMFPIGEVFTESRDLERVNGRARIYVFADLDFRVTAVEVPITLVIERGRVVATEDSTPAFDAVLARIRADEGEVWVRELGFGMNRSFSRSRLVGDIGAFERVCGVHLSLGAKHGVFKKPGFRHKEARHHVDVFPVTDRVLLDDQVVFEHGAWQAR